MPPLLPEVPHPLRDVVAALRGRSPMLCLSVDLLRDLGVVFKVRSPPESVLLVSRAEGRGHGELLLPELC